MLSLQEQQITTDPISILVEVAQFLRPLLPTVQLDNQIEQGCRVLNKCNRTEILDAPMAWKDTISNLVSIAVTPLGDFSQGLKPST